MINLISFVDTLRACACTNLKEAVQEPACRLYVDNVLIALIIAIAVCIVAYHICDKVYNFAMTRKENGVKTIVVNLVENDPLVQGKIHDLVEKEFKALADKEIKARVDDEIKALVKEESLKETPKTDE